MAVFGGLGFIIGLIILRLKPCENAIGHYGGLLAYLFIYVVVFAIISTRHQKAITKRNFMYCKNCSREFDPQTLAIGVLENKCEECGSEIYDT